MADFRMPSLGADMDAGTLIEWLVAPGARVKRGDVVALVETQKGIVEIEIWDSGTIETLVVQPHTKVPVGTVLATLRPDAAAPSPAAPSPAAPSPAAPSPAAPSPAAPSPAAARATNGNGAAKPAADGVHVRASPAARQLARERGVDLTKLHGTGPHEAITRDDILAATAAAVPVTAAAPAVTPPVRPATHDMSGMRRAIAAAMAKSKREIPHYYLSTEIDVSRAIAWLEAENAKRPVTERVLFAALLLKATALALREVPELNGFFVDGEHRPAEHVHVGTAIALRQGGLVAPAIHDVDRKSLGEIMASLSDLVARVRAGSLRSSEMTDPTVTVTSLGDQGTDAVFGVIYPPQVALVGFGTVRERPWAEGGMLGVRPVVHASLAADHRVSDGHRGARFLAALTRLLGAPEKL